MLNIYNFLKKIPLFLIKIYQIILSPDHSFWGKKIYPHGYCRFYPSCSEYTYKSIEKYGIVRGSYRGLKRVIRCNPWNEGGIDLP